MKTELPDRPADLIRLAVLDLLSVAEDPRYVVDMQKWHAVEWTPADVAECHVCFAGAVMAKSLGTPSTRTFEPHFFDSSVYTKVRALDAFRCGNIALAYLVLGQYQPRTLLDEIANIVCWREDPELFVIGMLDLAYLIDQAEAEEATT